MARRRGEVPKIDATCEATRQGEDQVAARDLHHQNPQFRRMDGNEHLVLGEGQLGRTQDFLGHWQLPHAAV